jgi:DNA polymerase I
MVFTVGGMLSTVKLLPAIASTLKHPQDIYKLKDKILDLKSVKEIREYDIPFYRRYFIDKGLFPMNIVECRGKY